MKKTLAFILMTAMLLSLPVLCGAETGQAPGRPVIGISWREDTDSEFFTNICEAIEAAGGSWVMLDQVRSADLQYDGEGRLTQGVTPLGSLDSAAAKAVRVNTWHDSNAEDAVKDIGFVVFTGGEDISPSLFYDPEPWHGVVEEIDYNAERDVSDYLTMSYCLDHDIPVLGSCRGMQMLAVVSGAEIMQDIPAYFLEHGLKYEYEFRNRKVTPDSYRDYSSHDVVVAPDSFFYDMVGSDRISGCPSWHHQAVKNVDNTRLKVTGTTEIDGIRMIQVIERTDKTFAVGLQFHPEAALVKHLEGAANRDDYMSYETALSIFEWIVQERYLEQEEAA